MACGGRDKLPLNSHRSPPVGVLSSGSSLVEPWDTSYLNAIVKLKWAQETVKSKQAEVKKAERGTRVQFQELKFCAPGGIVTASRIVDCARISRQSDW